MSECSVCGAALGRSGGRCDGCGEIYCSIHRATANHTCSDDWTVPASERAARRASDAAASVSGALGTLVGVLTDRRLLLVVFVGLPVVLVGAVGTGVLGAGDVTGTPAEPVVSGVEGIVEGAQEERLNETEAERLVHDRVNEERQEAGVGQLSYDDELAGVAEEHSENMANNDFVAHTSPSGETPQDRVNFACSVGENIAKTYWHTRIERMGMTQTIESEDELARTIVEDWLFSRGHRENLLHREYVSEGIGIATDGDEVYVTQLFCAA